jgi:tRNA A-37 threonylcarbamoyl transferase component Bud32
MAAIKLVNPRYDQLVREHHLDDFDRMMRWHDGEKVGRHASRDATRFEIEQGGKVIRLFLKREWQTYFKDRLKNWVSGLGWSTKSRREWHVLQAMAEAGVGCAEPVVYVERQAFRPQAFLLLREISHTMLLCPFLAERMAPATVRRRHQFAAHLGREIARLHAAGIDHPDLVSKHVLLSVGSEQSALPAVWFIDMQRSRTKATISGAQRVRDLASLDATVHPRLASETDRLALLDAYLSTGTLSADVREFIRAIRSRSRVLLRRSRFRALRNATYDEPLNKE